MLTPEHVLLKRQRGVTRLSPYAGADTAQALALCGRAIDAWQDSVGHSRATLLTNLRALVAAPCSEKAKAAVLRCVVDLVEDDAAEAHDVDEHVDPAMVREHVFTMAARARAAGKFVRDDIVHQVADALGLPANAIDASLFADLEMNQLVRGDRIMSPQDLLALWQERELHALLFRATHLTLVVDATTTMLRSIVQRLRMLQLLFDVSATDDHVRIAIDGPLSLSERTTHYGRKFVQVARLLRSCRTATLEAELVLKRGRTVERFVHDWQSDSEVLEPSALPPLLSRLWAEALVARCDNANHDHEQRFCGRTAMAIVHNSAGVFVPDFVIHDAQNQQDVLVEVLGYWSRAAVWRRIEMAQAGRVPPTVFVVSEKLRVKAEALPASETHAAELYLYKHTPSPTRLLECIARVAEAQKQRSTTPNR